jgi:hypothetical protein
MRNWQAFRTHHSNQIQIAMARSRGLRGTRKGMKPGDKSSGASVAYCSACQGAYVDSRPGRARHAQKGGKCALAMVSGKNSNGGSAGLGSPEGHTAALPEKTSPGANSNGGKRDLSLPPEPPAAALRKKGKKHGD